MGQGPAIDSRHYIVAFELRGEDDCPPDFQLPSSLTSFDAGIFLPRDPPDWFGRSLYPPRLLLLNGNALDIVSHPSTGEPPCRWLMEQISSVESGHMLLKGWLRFTGSGFDYTIRYNTRGFGSVFRFMQRFRNKLLPGTEPRGDRTIHRSAGLDIKFASALEREMDIGETILMQVFQAPKEVTFRSWLIPRRRWIAGDLLALTSRRLLWITDRERGFYSRYGCIASYARFDAVLGVGLRSGPCGHILQVDLNGGSAWRIPIAFESQSDRQRLAEDFAAALEVQKRRKEGIVGRPIMAAPDLSRSGVDALESASAGRIACPTKPLPHRCGAERT